jgi:hypothetical protein
MKTTYLINIGCAMASPWLNHRPDEAPRRGLFPLLVTDWCIR